MSRREKEEEEEKKKNKAVGEDMEGERSARY